MKIGVIVESVILRVNGGKPGPDDSVLRSDVRAYLPVAINYALDKAYNINANEERDREMGGDFYAFHGPIALTKEGDSVSFELEKNVVALKVNAGIRFIYDNCDNYYSPVPDGALPNLKYYHSLTPGINWWRRIGNKIQLYTHNPLVETINYQAITDVTALSDDDEAPIQAGLENDVMTIMANWFLGTKEMPYDADADSKDDANSSR